MAPKTQVNSSTGIMGPTGSGKSSLAATLADYLWERWKKVLLYYVSDGGGYPAEVQARIAIGLIRVFRMQTRDPGDLGLAFETCYRAAQGWWPKKIDPTTGQVEPGVEMIPPIAKVWEISCGQGHLLKKVQSQNLIQAGYCNACKRAIPKTELQVRATMIRNKGFEQVGGVFFDGLSSMLSWELRELGHRAGRMELKGEEAAIGGKVTSGDLKFGGVTRSHVGFAQTRGEELVHLALGIPNLMVPPVFTMLTHEDVDDRSLSIRGPKIAGRAKTDEAPQWFGNMLEVAKVPALQAAGEQRVLYLSEFTDQNGVKHLLKHRGSPGTMPDILADPPGDDPSTSWSQVNLGVFFRMLDTALDGRIEAVQGQFPDAPGLPEGIVEYGDPMVQPAPAPQAQVPAAATATPATTAPAAGAPLAATVAGPGAKAPAPKAKAPRGKTNSTATAQAGVPAPRTAETITSAEVAEVPAEQLLGQPIAPAPVDASPAPPTPTPIQTPPVPPQPPVQATAAPAPRPRVAPPAGARPAMAAPAGQRPLSPPAPRPAGVTTATTAPRPPAAAPRPPAAAPRPPAPAAKAQ